jgi:hypothetical protein
VKVNTSLLTLTPISVCVMGEAAIKSQIDERIFIERKSSFISFRNYFFPGTSLADTSVKPQLQLNGYPLVQREK